MPVLPRGTEVEKGPESVAKTAVASEAVVESKMGDEATAEAVVGPAAEVEGRVAPAVGLPGVAWEAVGVSEPGVLAVVDRAGAAASVVPWEAEEGAREDVTSRPAGETAEVAEAAGDDTVVAESVVEGMFLPDSDVTANAVV